MAKLSLLGHPKFLLLCRLLRRPKYAGLGCLELIWNHAYAASSATIGSADYVEVLADWDGEPGSLVSALVNCGGRGRAGFLVEVGDGCYAVHNLVKHLPDWAKKRWKRVHGSLPSETETDESAEEVEPTVAERRRTADSGGRSSPFGGHRLSLSLSPSAGEKTTSGSYATLPSAAAAACRDWLDQVEAHWRQIKPARAPHLSAAERESLTAFAEEGVPVEVVTECVGEIVARQDAAGRPVGRFAYFTGGILTEAVRDWREGRSEALPFDLESYRTLRLATLRDPGSLLTAGASAELLQRVTRAVQRARSTREIDAALQALTRHETAA